MSIELPIKQRFIEIRQEYFDAKAAGENIAGYTDKFLTFAEIFYNALLDKQEPAK